MIIRVDNTPRDYAWGSTTAIAELRGVQPSGKPEAELWLGTHPGSPTQISDPASAGGAKTIAELLDKQGYAPLPYLMKILAAAHPLSIQAHPSRAQAQEGFARENSAGVPLDAPHRNYRDDEHKPELIYALSETFEALCGFRPIPETIAQLEEFVAANIDVCAPTVALTEFISELNQRGEAALAWAMEWALSGNNAQTLVAEVCVAGAKLKDSLISELAQDYPGDPGIVVALLLNRVTLRKGQVLYLPAGNVHAYIKGLGVELMAASDNVLRGGLTPKHVDVPELLSVISTEVLPVPYLEAEAIGQGVEIFSPDVPDFSLVHVHAQQEDADSTSIQLTRPAMATCTSGTLTITGAHSSLELSRGENAFISEEEAAISVRGSGELFIAV